MFMGSILEPLLSCRHISLKRAPKAIIFTVIVRITEPKNRKITYFCTSIVKFVYQIGAISPNSD